MAVQNFQLLTWDGSKQKRIDSETAEIKLGKISVGVFTDLEAALSQEISDRQAAITAEQADRAAADTTLQGNIDTVSANLAQELLDRASGDSSTLASAQAYADQKVADLVDSAPAVLDTLKELSTALGDDPNFATTITNSLAATQAEVDAEEVRAAAAEAALASDIAGHESRLDVMDEIDNTKQVVVLENNAAVYSDASPAIQDPSHREGWYFKNVGPVNTAQNKMNWYFYDGSAQSVQLGDFSAYAIITFDSLVSKPHLAFYTTPTGSGDAAAWYKSRVVYLADQAPVAGVKYLMYFGQDPKVHPELPRLTMAKESLTSSGTQASSEVVMTAVLGSDSATALGNCEFVAEAVGVYSPSFKQKVSLKIRKSSEAALQSEISRATAAEAGLQGQIDSLTGSSITALQAEIDAVEADLAQELLDRASADSALSGRLDTLEGSGAGSVAKAQSDAQAYADAVVAVETSRAETAEGDLQSNIDDVAADLAQELLDRASAVTAEQARAEAAESALSGRLDVIEGSGAGSVAKAQADAQAYADAAVLVEKNRAEAAEAALQGDIDTVEANLAQELLDRASADASLQGEIDALEAVVADIKKVSKVASGAIGQGKICYVKADGTVALAIASIDLSDAQLLVSAEAIADGASGKFFVVEGSVIGGFVSLTPGKRYFVSAASAGAVVANLTGFSSGNSVYSVGRAISATEIAFAPVYEFEY